MNEELNTLKEWKSDGRGKTMSECFDWKNSHSQMFIEGYRVAKEKYCKEWHRVDDNHDDLPTEDKEYLVKVVFDVGTGNEHIFLAQWWNENKFWDSLYKDDIVAWKEIE